MIMICLMMGMCPQLVILRLSKMEHHRAPEVSAWAFKARLPHCEIWQNGSTMTIAQAYPIEPQQRNHSRINRNLPHLVNTFGVVCEKRHQQNYLLVERIPNRLSEVQVLSQAQSLKVMHAVFKGLEELVPTYGIVNITESCICFTENGKVKIWVNSDLSSIHPIFKPRQNGNSLNSIYNSIYQIVAIIQKKCFSTTFLRSFLKKLSESKIRTHSEAADQILKIAELLFITIEEKPKQTGGIKYQQMIEELNSLRANRKEGSGHSRNFSDFREIKEKKHRRYESNYEKAYRKGSQIPSLNFNILKESPAKNKINTQAYKSAPLTPRDDIPTENKANVQTDPTKTNTKQQPQGSFQKKAEKIVDDYCSFSTIEKENSLDPILEQTSHFNDSFSSHLKNEDKIVQASGEFQTFGILEDDVERCKKYVRSGDKIEKENKENQQIKFEKRPRNDKYRDCTAQEMEIEIERKLKLRASEHNNYNPYEKVKPNQPPIDYTRTKSQMFKMYVGRDQKVLTPPVQEEVKEVKENPSCYPISPNRIRSYQSPSLAFIDKKYQQYMRANKKMNQVQSRSPNMTSLHHSPSPSRHLKQWSNYQNTSQTYSQTLSQFPSKYSTNYPLNQTTHSWNSPSRFGNSKTSNGFLSYDSPSKKWQQNSYGISNDNNNRKLDYDDKNDYRRWAS